VEIAVARIFLAMVRPRVVACQSLCPQPAEHATVMRHHVAVGFGVPGGGMPAGRQFDPQQAIRVPRLLGRDADEIAKTPPADR